MITFLSAFPPYRGGIAKFTDSLYHHLRLQTEVKPYSFKKLYPDLLFPGTSQTLKDAKTGYAPKVFHPYQPLSWNRAADQLLADNPDYILYSYWHPFFAPAYNWVLARCKKAKPSLRTISITHNIMPHEYFPLKEALTQKLLNQTDLTILLSEQTENDFRELNSSSKHQKLFHPIYQLDKPAQSNSELRKKYGFTEDDQIVLFMGLVRDYKGVDVLINAFNAIHAEGRKIKPFIVGEFYTNKSKLLNLIHVDYGHLYTIKDEFIPEQAMGEILAISNLLVLPYKKASQSGVLANAIHFNLPALVSNQPGLSEHITHKHDGLIFDTNDAQDLKNKILDYFDTGLQEKLSENLNTLKKELSWKKFTGELLETIKRM